ncbi:methionine biosynthesis protein MetW [Chromobacterium amazonense]|uniref:Methionine biosynthesis protein MetW n=1 Tax=Chromobacterium amazonense TaxID=1382803 RepID=A0A2S9X916_9NEIS|nr:methionine biosynthesis protein MetW [Chromobacterium amazonense]KIA79702.1 methionine biosynthesis protein MetW [Chromobacterium piscinae]MBM2885370.1 methionine biosynthesis protein MetW [Chromobacterium amazonense]MDE1714262.1 methionine biosynthesis protein MetW [Chromobacterium amazonense]MDQ4540791.1 methionine biosynthesis protein MetW [Chromobacterium amazonense]PRP72146.1 methionine biosynthesis protein MetW [Chromobacterium amazonense]
MSAIQTLRPDLQLIADWIAPRSRVLDLGCGDGQLLAALQQDKQVQAYGVDFDVANVVRCVASGVNAIQGDLETGLADFGDARFDHVVLSQTIQAMRHTEAILNEMLRVGREAIVTFPNFGYWQNRLQILQGHMPVSDTIPYQWYDTPNIHWCMLGDFEELCAKNRIRVMQRVVMDKGKRVSLLPNLRGSLAFYRVARG